MFAHSDIKGPSYIHTFSIRKGEEMVPDVVNPLAHIFVPEILAKQVLQTATALEKMSPKLKCWP